MPAFKGPQKYVKKHKTLRNIKNPTIASAEFVFHYITYDIHESNLNIIPNTNTNDNTVQLYYNFNYFDETHAHVGGRIYHFSVPREEIRLPPNSNTLEYTVQSYEMEDDEYLIIGPATFRVTLTPEAAVKLRSM
jgi:hypothetical protein